MKHIYAIHARRLNFTFINKTTTFFQIYFFIYNFSSLITLIFNSCNFLLYQQMRNPSYTEYPITEKNLSKYSSINHNKVLELFRDYSQSWSIFHMTLIHNTFMYFLLIRELYYYILYGQ